MFFSISSAPQKNFSHFYHLGPHTISTDAGWQRHDTDNYSCVYKGYCDSGRMPDLLNQIAAQTEPELFGNFCMIVYNNHTGQLEIKSDRWRGFPIFYTDRVGITNLAPMNQTAWTNCLVTVNTDFSIVINTFKVIGELDDTPVDRSEIVEFIDQRLSQKAKNLAQFNTLPIRAFLSGGVDTALVFSYIHRYVPDYELIKGNVIEYDRFWLQNSADLGEKYWGYKQIHHWTTPCMLTSGTPGDEFMLRSPSHVDQFLKYHGIQISDLLTQRTWLHSAYFNQPKHVELFKTQTVNPKRPLKLLQHNLCNGSINDWQHWHIGNTLTWTPLRDLEIYKMFLRLHPEAAIPQIMDSAISIELMERNYPGLSRIISDQKNTGNYLKNLADFLLGPA